MANLFCQEHNQEITDLCQQEDCRNHKQRLCCYKCTQKLHINHRIVNIKTLEDIFNTTRTQLEQLYSDNEGKAENIRQLVQTINKIIKNDIEILTRVINNFNQCSIKELLNCYKICIDKSFEKLKIMSKTSIKQQIIPQTPLKELIELQQTEVSSRNFDKALQYTKEIIKQAPQCAIFQREKSRIEETIKTYKRHIEQGNTLFQQKKYSEAFGHYKEIIDQNTDNFTLCLQTGICLRKLNRKEESINYFLICDNMDPTNKILLYEKSQALFDLQDVQGLECCHNIMKTTNHDKEPLIYVNFNDCQGQLLLLQKDINQALVQFKLAGDSDLEAQLFKAIALQNLGGVGQKLEASLIKEKLVSQKYQHEKLNLLQTF